MDTAPPILPPTNDWIFKLLFGDERSLNVRDICESAVERGSANINAGAL
jgi:hypothetical protein